MLDAGKTEVATTRLAKKEPLGDADVRTLLASVDEVLVAKGRGLRRLSAAGTTLADLKGPTGSFRAPMLKAGRRLLVGFSAEALSELLGKR